MSRVFHSENVESKVEDSECERRFAIAESRNVEVELNFWGWGMKFAELHAEDSESDVKYLTIRLAV